MKLLGREPALMIGALNSLIMVIGAAGIVGFGAGNAGLLVILVNAVLAAITAAVTRPIGPAAFTGVISAALAFGTSYGLNLSADLVMMINAAVYPLLAFLTRGNVSPIPTSVTLPSLEPTPEAAEATVDSARSA